MQEQKEGVLECHDGGCCCHDHCHDQEHHHEHEHEHHHAHTHEHHHGCACCHPEEHEGHEHEAEGHRDLILAGSAAVLLAAGMLIPGTYLPAILLLLAYLLVGFDILRQAFSNILHGEIFDENFLMAVASVGAICIGELPEAVLVMLLYRVGEYLQGLAVAKSRRSIRALMDIRPDHARVLENGTERMVEAKDVAVGQNILLRPGDRIPLDGTVLEGESQLDTSALTGESMPRDCAPGSEVLAGCINLSGALRVEVTHSFQDSAASRILQLVEHASRNKAVSEKFISRFARIYTPIVCLLAVVIAVVPALLGIFSWSDSIYNALCFLVISCPCALVISVPLSFFAGVGAASRRGVLVKGGNYLDALARAEVAAFDKTGTLTKGKLTITSVLPAEGISAQQLLSAAAAAERHSNHPIAQAILAAAAESASEDTASEVDEIRESSGKGVSVCWQGCQVLAGRADYLRSHQIQIPPVNGVGTKVFVAVDGVYWGALLLGDTLKEDAADAMAQLRGLGLKKLYMLTGDNKETADQIAGTLGLDGAYSQLLPEEKLSTMEQLRGQLSKKGKLLYTGDGINDTPVLTAADVGVAMGGLGADAAIEAADVVIMGDEPSRLSDGIRIARKTVRIAHENIVFSIAVKVLIMALAALHLVDLWLAVFADVGVCMITILNALRLNGKH